MTETNSEQKKSKKQDNRVKLTKTVCKNATYKGKGKKGFFALWDSEVRNFGLRISEKGSKQFIIMYRNHNRKRLMTLGQFGVLTVDQARKLAIQKLAEASQGKDPAGEKQRNRNIVTMKELCKDYLENYSKIHKKSWDEDENRIEREINPAVGSRPITSIIRRDISLIHAKKGKTAPYEANRILALYSAIFEYAKREGYFPEDRSNPARGIEKLIYLDLSQTLCYI